MTSYQKLKAENARLRAELEKFETQEETIDDFLIRQYFIKMRKAVNEQYEKTVWAGDTTETFHKFKGLLSQIK